MPHTRLIPVPEAQRLVDHQRQVNRTRQRLFVAMRNVALLKRELARLTADVEHTVPLDTLDRLTEDL